MEGLPWDKYFMSMVYLVAMRSKDKSTNIGAVIVGPDNEVRSTGYNSFPMGIDDNLSERQERPEKYYWFAHGEKNAIDHAARIGVSLKGCVMYTQGIPCMDCARSIVQSGIRKVVVHSKWEENSTAKKWSDNAIRTVQLFKEAGVELEYFKGDIITNLYGYCREKKIYF